MKTTLFTTVLLLPIIAIVACTQKSTAPAEEDIQAELQQVPGCQAFPSTQAAVPSDTCFSYLFADQLIIDFCLTGNCCPDSNRFDLSYRLSYDTIAVVAIDTAEDLCDCICTYVIHTELDHLPLDHYVFRCEQHRPDTSILWYVKDLYRQSTTYANS